MIPHPQVYAQMRQLIQSFGSSGFTEQHRESLVSAIDLYAKQADKVSPGFVWPADAAFQFKDKVVTEYGGKFGTVISTYKATGADRGYVVEFLGGRVATYAEGMLRKSR